MEYGIVLLMTGLAAVIVFGALAASRMLAPHRPGGRKNEPYECGEKTIGSAWVQFNVGYYLFALLFLVFDVEAAFLLPWALILREAGAAGLAAGGLFLAVLTVALVYAWRKGLLEWV